LLNSAKKDDYILIGKVLGTHGIRGQLRVLPYSGESESITGLEMFFLCGGEGKKEPYGIVRSVPHRKQVLVTLSGHDEINGVLPLIGREVYVRRDQLPSLPEGEFYWCDLLGLAVITNLGESLGELTDILKTGENDVYVVKSASREYLIPAIEGIVTEIDLEGRRMIITPLDGLLDL
jgi:16S rRNA processing protein RimM